MKLMRWLAALETEAHETFGTLETTMGAGILLGYGLHWALAGVRWLATVTLLLLLVCGLWYGQRLEYRLFARLGRRHFRGTLVLRVTWVTLAWAACWALVLWGVAAARAWTRLDGWRAGPVILLTVLSSYYITLGLALGLRRWLLLGLLLGAWLILIPGLAPLRQYLDLAVAGLAGLTLLATGMAGYRAYERELAALPLAHLED